MKQHCIIVNCHLICYYFLSYTGSLTQNLVLPVVYIILISIVCSTIFCLLGILLILLARVIKNRCHTKKTACDGQISNVESSMYPVYEDIALKPNASKKGVSYNMDENAAYGQQSALSKKSTTCKMDENPAYEQNLTVLWETAVSET